MANFFDMQCLSQIRVARNESSILLCVLFQGSVFFPLPDGQGLMYYVSGTAEPPKANGKITRDVPCKTTFIETLAVPNWLKKAQRFVELFQLRFTDILFY